MKFNRLGAALCAALGCLAMSCLILISSVPAAIAAEPSGTVFSLSDLIDPFRPYIVEAVTAVIGLVAGRLYMLVERYMRVSVEARHREAFQTAVRNGALAGFAYAQKHAGKVKVDVRSELVAEGLRYVLAAVPDAIRYFGVDEERVSEAIDAKLSEFLPPAPATVGVKYTAG
ncbi:hypothetical protein SAMN05892877_13214 [Rhizobium subbaraonis]|uniref:Uncharacterized protein n=1 Tax=Rhizobium subbaraonis TaxID=908946 RepID=A0A285V0S6_9HYPH|nr:hypothetical protein [Rhizobium subbaraonis]SOC47660.1 hypothetical protein SAMN05892877_13214 [Rhizobium subbaraonis]